MPKAVKIIAAIIGVVVVLVVLAAIVLPLIIDPNDYRNQIETTVLNRGRKIAPFVQVGAGAMSYDVQVAGVSRKATNLAFNAGLGADVPLAQNIGLRLFAKDYIGKFDINEATGVDYEAETSHNIALSAGLKLSF